MRRTHYTPGASAAHGPFCCCREHRPQLHRQERTMQKLTDTEIREWLDLTERRPPTIDHGLTLYALRLAVSELRDLRAQRAASRERVMEVVREASIGVLAPIGVRAAHIPAEDIAARVADALAAPQPAIDAALVLEVVERAVADWLAMNCAPSSTMADVQVASAVMGKGIAARVAEQLAGQEVTLSAEDRKALRELREELRESMDADHPGLAAFDRLLSTPCQGARPESGDVPRDEHCSRTGGGCELHPRRCPDVEERDAARRGAARLAEAFEEATCKLAMTVTAKENAEHDLDAARRELADARGEIDTAWAILGGSPQETLRQAAERVEANCAERARERDAARAERLSGDRLVDQPAKAERERDCALIKVAELTEDVRAGDERLAGVLDGTFSVGDGTAQREIERLRAECERLRKDWSMYNDYQFRSEYERLKHADVTQGKRIAVMLTSIRTLLATEPAVSEERCGEIAKSRGLMIAGHHHRERSEIAKSLADHIPDLLAAARQLHALRAGLREIVGGEPAPRAWAVTPERVGALRWASKEADSIELAFGTYTGGDAIKAARHLAAMLAEVSP